jgi:hypothetical protein
MLAVLVLPPMVLVLLLLPLLLPTSRTRGRSTCSSTRAKATTTPSPASSSPRTANGSLAPVRLNGQTGAPSGGGDHAEMSVCLSVCL